MNKRQVIIVLAGLIAVALVGCSGVVAGGAGADKSNGTTVVSTAAATSSAAEDVAHGVVKTLEDKGITITTMESCTAGLVASTITDTEGASAVFPGGFVTYSNDAKVKAGVDASIIDTYGVYSAECAEAMARAAQGAFGTDVAIGVTGTTGNVDPNNPGSTRGEVYYCILMNGEAHSYHLRMDVDGMTRGEIKRAYVDDVFEELAKLVG